MIGIDFGASFLDVAIIRDRKLERTYSIQQKHYSHEFLENILANELALEGGKLEKEKKHLPVRKTPSGKDKIAIFVAGKKNANIPKLKKRMRIREVGEIAAIAEGARFLAGNGHFIVMNVGTGTPIVLVDGNKHKHLAGTGLGGGTLEGLGKILLALEVNELEGLAAKGSNALDLTIDDVVGKRFGVIPGNATASNFGKAAGVLRPRDADIAYSLLCLVGETLGVMAALAANGNNCREIVFTGRVVGENALIREKIEGAVKLFGGKVVFPRDGKFCTAIGAALAGMKKTI
ncbi:MAG: hypothetical protein ABH863_04860 [Candidatus Micrarchaeota archaeon]